MQRLVLVVSLIGAALGLHCGAQNRLPGFALHAATIAHRVNDPLQTRSSWDFVVTAELSFRPNTTPARVLRASQVTTATGSQDLEPGASTTPAADSCEAAELCAWQVTQTAETLVALGDGESTNEDAP